MSFARNKEEIDELGAWLRIVIYKAYFNIFPSRELLRKIRLAMYDKVRIKMKLLLIR